MASKKRLLFFVNPKAGTSGRALGPDQVQTRLGKGFTIDWHYWAKGVDGTALIRRYLDRDHYHRVVAVGGDGTVNQVAAALIHSPTPLAIVPRGSGNGLARHLGIPLDVPGALDLAARGHAATIDTARIGLHPFVCTAGVGFDAHIGHLFDSAPRRGFVTYARLGLRELHTYRPRPYDLLVDGRPLTVQAYLVTFGNAAQWGNDAHIVPLADIRDGLLHVSIIQPFNRLYTPILIARLFNRTLHHCRHVRTLAGRSLRIRPHQPGYFHFDGEPRAMRGELGVQIEPASLNVIKPPVS